MLVQRLYRRIFGFLVRGLVKKKIEYANANGKARTLSQHILYKKDKRAFNLRINL